MLISPKHEKIIKTITELQKNQNTPLDNLFGNFLIDKAKICSNMIKKKISDILEKQEDSQTYNEFVLSNSTELIAKKDKIINWVKNEIAPLFFNENENITLKKAIRIAIQTITFRLKKLFENSNAEIVDKEDLVISKANLFEKVQLNESEINQHFTHKNLNNEEIQSRLNHGYWLAF